MSESVGRRVARLVSGCFNAIVDAVENAARETVIQRAQSALVDSLSLPRAPSRQ